MPRQILLLYFQTLSGILHKFMPFIPGAAPSLAPQRHIFVHPRGSSSLPFLSYPSNFQLSPRRSEKRQCKWLKGQSFYILHHSREIFLLLFLVHFCHLSCISLIYFLWFKKDKNLHCSQCFSNSIMVYTIKYLMTYNVFLYTDLCESQFYKVSEHYYSEILFLNIKTSKF